jgi:hypothetical protein
MEDNMLHPSSVYKQPWEIIRYTLDVSALLVSGAMISSLEVRAFDVAGNDVTPSIIDASAYGESEVYITVKNGTANSRYDIRVRLILSDGQRFEEDLILRVVEHNAS